MLVIKAGIKNQKHNSSAYVSNTLLSCPLKKQLSISSLYISLIKIMIMYNSLKSILTLFYNL